MDQNSLVVDRLGKGVQVLKQLVQNHFEVEVAFWTRMDDQFQLHIVSHQVELVGLKASYTKLYEALGQFAARLSILEMDLVGTTDPAAMDVISIQRNRQEQSGVVLGSGTLGGRTIEWGYIYPRNYGHPVDSSTQYPVDLFFHLYELIRRGPGPMPPSRVALRDGKSFDGVPISFSMGVDQASVVQFRVDGEPVPRVVAAQEILAIL